MLGWASGRAWARHDPWRRCAAYLRAKRGEKDVIGSAESRWGARDLRLTHATARIISEMHTLFAYVTALSGMRETIAKQYFLLEGYVD